MKKNQHPKYYLRALLVKKKYYPLTQTERWLGYSGYTLRMWLEQQFTDGMSWDNYGEWHIEHVIPVAAHHKVWVMDARVINRLSNLKPEWKKDNWDKQSSDAVKYNLNCGTHPKFRQAVTRGTDNE